MSWWLSLGFLGIGVLIGFLAQRSRMCFVAGFRDWLLVRDTELLLGLFSFLATVWLAASLGYALGLLRRGMPEYGELEVRTSVAGQVLSSLRLANLRELRLLGKAEQSVSLSALANRFLYASIGGGWLMGILSVLAGGCVLRQHVLAVQGSRNAWLYLAGFYAGVPLYYLLLARFLGWVYQ